MILHIEGTRRKDQTLVLGTWEPVITTWFPPDFLIPPARARKPGEDRSKERVASSPKVAGTNLADAPWRKPIGRRNVVHEHESDNQTNISGRCYSVRKFQYDYGHEIEDLAAEQANVLTDHARIYHVLYASRWRESRSSKLLAAYYSRLGVLEHY